MGTLIDTSVLVAVERGDLDQRAARAREQSDADAGENQGVQHGDVGHVC